MRIYPIAASLACAAALAACSSGQTPVPPAASESASGDAASAPASERSAPSLKPAMEGARGNDASAKPKATAKPAGADSVDGIPARCIEFAPGKQSATIEGSIKGFETVDYLLGVKAGQAINIAMATKNAATFFNLLAPGAADVAVFDGSMNHNQYEGIATRGGDYRIRVYMKRSAARRDERAVYRLEAIIN